MRTHPAIAHSLETIRKELALRLLETEKSGETTGTILQHIDLRLTENLIAAVFKKHLQISKVEKGDLATTLDNISDKYLKPLAEKLVSHLP